MTFDVRRHATTECPDLSDLLILSAAEGHSFVARTTDEWEAGVNRFDQAGEVFLVAITDGRIVGMCGLNTDPYLDDPVVGRLRHLYVHPSHRRAGMAAALVARCLTHGRGSFERVRLRTSNPAAGALYCALGFEPVDDPDATHEWRP